MFKTQEPKNHTLFSSRYILYTCLGQIKVSPSPGFAHGILQFLEVEIMQK